ncbi:MAG: hypothetical protein MI922_14545 [Bacteroidales bacterium]|nr:hypothetical protein [Bacteroidales bacterium]
MKRKKLNKIILGIAILSLLYACERELYNHDIKTYVEFQGIEIGEDNIITIEDGVTQYLVEGTVTSENGLLNFAIYNADTRSGVEESDPIENTKVIFDEGNAPKTHEFSYLVENIESNAALKVIVEDIYGARFKTGLVIKITPQVLFSGTKKIESYDYFYGPYYATWYEGRTYMEREVEPWADAVEITMGDFDSVPYFVSPSARKEYGLTSYKGAKPTKFQLTNLVKDDFDAISEIDRKPLLEYTPVNDTARIVAGRVYAFLTHDDKHGLVYVDKLEVTEHRDLENVTIFTSTFKTKIESN